MSQGGKFALPMGTTREISDVSSRVLTNTDKKLTRQTFEEVVIPPGRPIPPRVNEKPVKIADLSPMAKGCFPVRPCTPSVCPRTTH
jgi:antiviral helicase SLH1